MYYIINKGVELTTQPWLTNLRESFQVLLCVLMCKRDVNMATLILTVGCSGSGKSTYTEDFLKYHDAVNLNRDDVRFTLVSPNAKGWGDYFFNDFNEGIVTKHIQAKFLEAVYEGKDIIVSDTNLNKTIREDKNYK